MKMTIRPTEPSDANAITRIRRMPGVIETITAIPSERYSLQEGYLAGLSADHHSFVAVVPDENGEELVVGNAFLEASSRPRSRHCAWLGIMVHADYQGMGVGTQLMMSVLDIADNWLMLTRVELSVCTDNETAIRLYQKFGFEAEGIQRMATIRNGAYEDVLMMSRLRLNSDCGKYPHVHMK